MNGSGIADLVGTVSIQLDIVATRLRNDEASANDLKMCSGLLAVLAETLILYAEKMPAAQSCDKPSPTKLPPPM